MRLRLLAALAIGIGGAPAHAGDGVPAPPPPVAQPEPPPTGRAPSVERAPTDLGVFRLAADAVVDADTLRLENPQENVRIHALDAEEIFHNEADRAAAAADFAAYVERQRTGRSVPVKFATPAGEAAKTWTAAFFQGVALVRLESDEAGRERDAYGRRLAHVLVERDGKDVLFAEEAIRAGWSPYFVKYGRSLLYDARFVAAQEEARAGKRGIWGDGVPHYPDYAERLAWWESRAKQVDAWAAETRENPARLDRIRLGVPAETARLASLVGKPVTLFASFDMEDLDSEPPRLLLIDQPRRPFPVVVPDKAVWNALDRRGLVLRFVRVTGVFEVNRGKRWITLTSASDITTR